MTLQQEIKIAYENAITNAQIRESIVWQMIEDYPLISFGYDPKEDSLFLAMAPSNHNHTEWEAITTVFEKRIAAIDGLPGAFQSSLCLRFNNELLKRSLMIDFIADLIIDATDTDLDQHFINIFSIWESMFALFGSPLNTIQIRGLIGELLVLDSLIEHQGLDAVMSWVGPTGTLHDFENDQWHIEVKESMRPDPIAMIHPINQLEPIEIPFNLVIVGLSRNFDGTSLNDLIEKIRAQIGIDIISGNHFEEVLSASGYLNHSSASEAEKYSLTLFSRLPINGIANVLFPAMISNNVNYDDIRWRLRWSDHPFIPIEDNYWTNPSI